MSLSIENKKYHKFPQRGPTLRTRQHTQQRVEGKLSHNCFLWSLKNRQENILQVLGVFSGETVQFLKRYSLYKMKIY